ncbi:MAG TPA: response regulator transcription factor [Solirubrobacteraceae bacterium]|jgi:DNA-binding NarL/FixJ family response regulator
MPANLHLALSTGPSPEASLVSLPIRVVLADDHALMRRGLRLLLDDEQDLDVVAEASDLAAAELAVERLHPHVLVLDRRMPDGSSIELIRALRARAPKTQIVVLTMEQSPAFARSVLVAGAIGFAVKELADTELPLAVRAAARGEEYVSPHVASRLAPASPSNPRGRLHRA